MSLGKNYDGQECSLAMALEVVGAREDRVSLALRTPRRMLSPIP
ncbi:hypothetical protein ABGB18_29860 [Nonomuraea sp. B12E4]